MFRQRRISLRKGAELPALTYQEFIDLASRHRICVSEYEEGWGEREVEGLQALESQNP